MLRSLRLAVFSAAAVASAVAASDVAPAREPGRPPRLIGLAANFLSLAPFTPGQLLEIDPATGATSPFGPGYPIEVQQIGLNLAADSHGWLFNVYSPLDVDVDALPKLNQFNPRTGLIVGSLPLDFGTDDPYDIYATAFDSEDRLHAIALNSAPNVTAVPVLVEIDVASGQVIFGEVVDTLNYTGLAFDSDDNLFAVAPGAGLVALDVATGRTTILGGDLASPDSLAASPSLAFDPRDELYAAADQLLRVDPVTGMASAVSERSFRPWTIVGLDFAVSSLASDFDLDGDVDGNDFLTWQTNFPLTGGSATFAQGDANGDGNVDGTDLLLWQQEYFSPDEVGTALAAIPEPASVAFLMTLAVLGIWRRSYHSVIDASKS